MNSTRGTHQKSGWLRALLSAILVLVWLAVAGIGGPYFGKISEVSTNSQTDFLPASAESTQVVERQSDFFAGDTVPAILVFEADSELSDEHRSYLESLPSQLVEDGATNGQTSPVLYSEDSRAAEIIVPLPADEAPADGVETIERTLSTPPAGLTSYITGPAGFAASLGAAFAGIDGVLLLVTLAVVFVILLAVYRSPIIPIIALLTSMVALSGAIFVVWNMANAGWVMINGQVQGILLILVVGSATDYSLLYVARYREALTLHRNRFDATRAALRGSWEPIVASGGTVIAGLLCLLLSALASNKALGPIAATGIVLSMAAALTFLPAALALSGRFAFWPVRPRYQEEHRESPGGLWAKVADFVSAKPRAVWAATAAALAVCAGFALTFQAEGIRQSEIIVGQSESRDGQRVLAEHFPGGSGSPANIIISADALDAAAERLDALDSVDSLAVVAADSPSGTLPVGASAPNPLPPVFAQASPTQVEGNVLLQATLTDPADSPQAEQAVLDIRAATQSVDANALVGGETATALDSNTSAARDLKVIIPAVLVVITLILMLLLRSIAAPLLLVAATVLSFLAALGVSAIVFNHILGFPGADPTVPLYGFVFLVALGIDYTIFLMTRVREESLTLGTRAGMRKGLIVTGGVITSAGIVLAATFAALAVIPLVFMIQLAFIVAFGVLLDATVVRALLIPALVEDIGQKVWWPSKLS
ncbi:MMPL family transporter [Rothia sp. ZJ1223]|uniref:MMPL family transporter n=1 Tax=Rothia sp. ZJ1223 TaxID=2811098 RepID=UPI0019589616|nr:MMPL family transporter [Rothia sp. ZJ1223]MBM7051990.1 MMPL family transporter [Rothia sp. ZJ1223]